MHGVSTNIVRAVPSSVWLGCLFHCTM